MSTTADNPSSREPTTEAGRPSCAPAAPSDARRRARRHPISRWYVCPAAGWLAAVLTPTRVRPVHLTLCGLAVGAIAAAVLVGAPHLAPVAGVLVLAAWLFDRADGQLARRQNTVTAWGAWLDANVDELLDVGLHGAVAAAAVRQTASGIPWLLLGAFLAGKYLFMHGMATEGQMREGAASAGRSEEDVEPVPASRAARVVRAAYHLPGNADVRVHLLAAALLAGWLSAELAIVAAYYNVRWITRYVLVARRLGGRG
ncbi:MAG TPA: CDP-alcohol phosphatidyltransferase family protein [Thermoguttaceae bacterium]|nr:CDP-alcohol phosphatidyltransferase family protein [Thermoguttaceae bacterium]